MKERRLLTILVVVCLISVSTPAGEGRIPLWEPTTITSTGKYVLTRNITATAGSPAIQVTSGSVDIDLNGFTVMGSNVNTIDVVGADSLAIRNGTVQGGTSAISVVSTTYVTVESVATLGSGIRVTGVQNFAIRNNIVDAVFVGIFVGTFGDTIGPGTIEGNVVRAANKGIWLSASNAKNVDIRDNRVDGGDGIFVNACESCYVATNFMTSEGSGEQGIHLNATFGSTVYKNTVKGGLEQGIELISSDGNLILENVVSGVLAAGGGFGISVGGNDNQIEGNLMTDNEGFGLILFGNNNVYRRNTARSNGSVPFGCSGTPVTTDFCDDTSGNTSHGDNYMPTQM